MNRPISIRSAIAADLPALTALIERAYRGKDARVGWTHEADLVAGARLGPTDLADALADPDVALLVADADEGPAGCVQVTRRAGDRAYLGLLTVEPARQGLGLGDRLLRGGEAAGRAFGRVTMEMTVIDARPELIAWYRRRGYRDTGERLPFPVPTLKPVEFVVLERRVC